MGSIFIGFILLLCSAWVLLYAYLMYSNKQLLHFHRLIIDAPTQWPRLSVIVPACNEAAHIQTAVNTLLTQNYPNLEIILVNDRSSDNTGDIINALATQDTRVKPVHIDTLPDGWLGKVHALHLATQQATGDWLLFTDADIHFDNEVLKRAVAYCLQTHTDHLALMPNVETQGYWLKVVISTFGLLFLLNTKAARINKPDSKAFIGIGAFNLVKRDTFNKTPGFEWLKLEVVDDMGVAYMMKVAGEKSCFALAYQDLRLHWYDNIAAMFRGLEKNLFATGAGYRWWKSATQVLQLWLLLAAPVVALCSSTPLLLIFGLVVIVMHLLFSITCIREKQSESLSLFMFPVGVFILSLMILWSAFQCLRKGGINWRGTYYSLEELRKGQRIRF